MFWEEVSSSLENVVKTNSSKNLEKENKSNVEIKLLPNESSKIQIKHSDNASKMDIPKEKEMNVSLIKSMYLLKN